MNLLNGKPDSHTYIHEMGHVLGLIDYYNTDNGKYGPLGRIDMMDYSIGDQNAMSKMLLNWTRPIQVTGEGDVTINIFSATGDCILMSNSWNGSALDEYILLEFYSPNGLNYIDSYQSWGDAKLPSQPGIKMYHIDARAGFYTNNNASTFLGYVSDSSLNYSKSTYRINMASTNSTSSKSGHPLIHLLEKSGENTFKNNEMATDDTLFHANDSFGYTSSFMSDEFPNGSFYKGERVPYKFVVKEITATTATISFEAR